MLPIYVCRVNSQPDRTRLLPLMGLFYYNSARAPYMVSWRAARIFGYAGRSGPIVSSFSRSFLAGCESWRGCLFEQASYEILKSSPHAGTGDKTLRFDYAASQAVPPSG